MTLALIVGRGDLPAAIAIAQDRPPLICALEGHPPKGLDVDLHFRLETLGSFLVILGQRGVTEVCFCGAIDRPSVDPTKLDAETLPLVPIFMKALQKGDDGALRAAMEIFEQTGFAIRAAHELLPDLLPDAGVLTKAKPDARHHADAALGEKVLAQMGKADLGQACVLRGGAVLAREDDRGTDAMLAQFAEEYVPHRQGFAPMDWALGVMDWVAAPIDEALDKLEAWLTGVEAEQEPAKRAATGALLFKGPKPEQDRRADLPTIGAGTALRAAEAGLDGIVIEAGGTILLDPDHVIRILDAMDMFLWVREAGEAA